MAYIYAFILYVIANPFCILIPFPCFSFLLTHFALQVFLPYNVIIQQKHQGWIYCFYLFIISNLKSNLWWKLPYALLSVMLVCDPFFLQLNFLQTSLLNFEHIQYKFKQYLVQFSKFTPVTTSSKLWITLLLPSCLGFLNIFHYY